MTIDEQIAFANEARRLRWGDAKSVIDTADLLAVDRDADRGDDLWRVMNRVQEHAVRGGVRGASAASGRVTRTRPLTAIQANLAFNVSLWALADRTAPGARAAVAAV